MFFLTIKKKIPGGKMKYFLLFITAVILTGCSSSKVELGSLNQDPCKNEVKLNNPKEFVGRQLRILQFTSRVNRLWHQWMLGLIATQTLILISTKQKNRLNLNCLTKVPNLLTAFA
jgi:hypothetical protein